MRVFIIAGELSGDKLGAALMAGLRQLVPDVTFDGVGGDLMTSQGLQSRFPMDELSVMGLVEILPKYVHLKKRIQEMADAVILSEPDVLITIDSPEFSSRVAKQVKARSTIRTVHYVAPSVWAWRPGRADKMAAYTDQVLALLPFEPPFMEKAGMRCDFVGHPVVSEPQASESDAAQFRLKQGIGDAPLMMVLPGSRKGEVNRLGPVFGQVLSDVLYQRDDLRIVLPAAKPVAGLVEEITQGWNLRNAPIILDPRDHSAEDFGALKRAAFKAADMALAASGTVSLELAAAGTPMVIAYDMNPISRFLISRMLQVDTATLVSLVSNTRVIPEFLGKDCRPEIIVPAVLETLDNPNAQINAMRDTMRQLGLGDEPPGLKAARAVLDGLGD
ncbi:MAG: lipid-A-disaccharide synthase [Paracoccaceae bacterium]|jgi:lipid-A-disaccharide synthase|nr:lipid-A-disaccharide synthase [Paracoccaceae bacterium]